LNGVKVLSIGDHVLFMEREEVLYYKKVAQVEQLVIDYAKEL
jgi:hypothetical protein